MTIFLNIHLVPHMSTPKFEFWIYQFLSRFYLFILQGLCFWFKRKRMLVLHNVCLIISKLFLCYLDKSGFLDSGFTKCLLKSDELHSLFGLAYNMLYTFYFLQFLNLSCMWWIFIVNVTYWHFFEGLFFKYFHLYSLLIF